MQLNLTLASILDVLKPESVVGATDLLVTNIAPLSQAKPGELSFLGNMKYKNEVPLTEASILLLPQDYIGEPKLGQVFIRVKNPSESLSLICKGIEASLSRIPAPGIHSTAIIHSTAQIHSTASIGPYCVVEEGSTLGANTVLVAQVYVGRFVSIGENSLLMPHVTVLDHCVIGSSVRLHSGVVVGSDGFGYHTTKEGIHLKDPQVGNAVIEDNVEIGSNTTIDRARFSETRIGQGTKIDNLVQIGHNVVIGPHCILVSQVGIAGSTQLGHHVILGGQAGLAGHLKIGDGSMVGGQSGVSADLPPKSYVRGSPAFPFNQAMRIDVLQRKLPELFARVAQLEKQLEVAAANKSKC